MFDYSFIQIINFEIGSNRHDDSLLEEDARRSGHGDVERDDDDFLLANRENWSYGDQSAENCSNSSRLRQLLLEEDEDVYL